MTSSNTIHKLDWISAHFGLAIASLCLDNITTNDSLLAALDESKRTGIDIVEACCTESAEKTINLLERNGFFFVGGNMNLRKELTGCQHLKDSHLTLATIKDIPELISISSGIFEHSRYTLYNIADNHKIPHLYEIWLEKGVKGEFDDECLLLNNDQTILAFSCMKYSGNSARISLFGVNPQFQLQGHGSDLLGALETHLKQRGIRSIEVKTQLKNLAALRLYQKAGYRTTATELYFVRHIAQ